jgi:hypothetical protein
MFEILGNNNASFSYQKLKSSRYQVKVSQAETPFTLVFKSTFNNLWEARINGEKISDHFLIYDYANAWKLNRKGDYTIDVVFKVWPWE